MGFKLKKKSSKVRKKKMNIVLNNYRYMPCKVVRYKELKI